MQPLTSTDPTQIGPHRALGRLGAGGMGAVYLARTPDRRLAALKIIHRELAESSDFQARFAREVRTAQVVRGPHTPAVIAAEPYGPTPWMATEYVPGPTLKDAVRSNGPFPEGSLRALALGLAQALQSVHAAGLMHRDLKPGNVLLSPRGPQVIDFGIARAVEGTVLTKTGQAFGTPAYASPETVLGREQTPASDLFSLAGVVLYAAQGQPPFGTKPAADVLTRVVNSEPDLACLPPGSLRELITRCLAKDPADRPTADELVRVLSAEPLPPAGHGWLPADVHRSIDFHEHELHTVANTAPALGGPPGRTDRQGQRARTWLVAVAAVIALVLVAGTGVVSLQQWGPSSSEEDASTAGDETTTPSATIDSEIRTMRFAPDGDGLFLHTWDGLSLWDWREGEVLADLGDSPTTFTTTASGAAVAVHDDRVTVWDNQQDEAAEYPLGEAEDPENPSIFEAGAPVPDSETVVFVERTREDDQFILRGWDWQTGDEWEEELDAPVSNVEYSPDGEHLALLDATVEGEQHATVVDADSLEPVFEAPETQNSHDSRPLYDVVFSPDGSLVAISNSDAPILVHDLEADETLHELRPREGVTGMTFDPDGEELFAGHGPSAGDPVGGVQWDMDTGEEMTSGNTLVYEWPVFHPEGEPLAVTDTQNDSSTVLFLDPETLSDTHQIG